MCLLVGIGHEADFSDMPGRKPDQVLPSTIARIASH
jgi:hypothetical protein